ncbi:Uncharacterised protein [Acinetobacter baumannii]|nr:Uncharacterised protein [Acinetobacter baumannii]
MPFHDHPAELFQIAVDILYLVRQLFNLGLEQIQQQFVSVAFEHRLVAGAHAVQAERRQFALAQGIQTPVADGKRHRGVAGVIFRIFKVEEGVDMQTVFVFEETGGGFDVVQFRTRRQALSQLILHALTLALFRLDQINPQR